MTSKEQNFARYLGLCRRAGGIIRGGETILRAVRAETPTKRPVLVLIASDASDRTVKQLVNKCQFYQVPYYRSEADSYELASLTGHTSPCAALGILKGKGPAEALLGLCAERNTENPSENTLPYSDREESKTEANRLLDRKDDGEWQ